MLKLLPRLAAAMALIGVAGQPLFAAALAERMADRKLRKFLRSAASRRPIC